MKKRLSIAILIILIILNIIFFIYDSFIQNKFSYIILDKNNVWRVNNDDVKYIDKKKIKRISFDKIRIYGDEEFSGYYDTKNNIIYNDSLESIPFSEKLILTKGDINIKNYSFNINSNITEQDELIVLDVLKREEKNESINELFISKIAIGTKVIYSVVPYEPSSFENKGAYSIIFVYENNESKIIYNKTTSQTKDNRLSSLNRVVDLDNDSIVEIILISDIPGSSGNECYSLYKYNNDTDNYESIIDCEA